MLQARASFVRLIHQGISIVLSYRRSTLVSSLTLIAAAMLGACNKSDTASTDPSAPAASAQAVATDGGITPDLSNSRCKLLPPEQIQAYQKAHDLFSSAPGLAPQFEKGHRFDFGTDINFKWDQAASKSLTMSVTLLRDCSESDAQAFAPLAESAPGSGILGTQIRPSIPGSDFPDGTPGVVRVQFTEVDASTMKGTTTILGEYTVRLVGSKE